MTLDNIKICTETALELHKNGFCGSENFPSIVLTYANPSYHLGYINVLSFI